MAVVSKTVLKSYFNDGDVPGESEYIDLIDTMGDMSKSVYDGNDDGTVEDSDALGGVAAVNYIQRVSANRPGVTRLYRDDSDSGYYLRSYWASPYWYLQGYLSGAYHAQVRVGYANVVPWSGITGKPATYTPSAHTHTGADLTSANFTVDVRTTAGIRAGSTSDVTNGDVWTSGDIRCGGGLIVGQIGVAVTNDQIWINDANTKVYEGGTNAVRLYSNYGYVDMGGVSTSYFMINTDRAYYRFDEGLNIRGGLLIGDNGSLGAPTDSAIRFYEGTTFIGEISTTDTTWLRLNQGVSKNIYTPRLIRADGGFWVYTNGRTAKFGQTDLDTHIYCDYDSSYASHYIGWYGGNASNLGATRIGNRNSAYGDIHADNFQNESKRSSKRNIRSYKDEEQALDLVKKILPIKYIKANPNASRTDQERIGFIAEDLIEILPEVVGIDQEGQPEGIDYGQITPLLTLAIQELMEKVERLENRR